MTRSTQRKPLFKRRRAPTARGPVLTRADVARLAAAAADALPEVLGVSDEAKQTIARALAEVGQARTWNLMIDVIAQTGKYTPGDTPLLATRQNSLWRAKNAIGFILRLIATTEPCSAAS